MSLSRTLLRLLAATKSGRSLSLHICGLIKDSDSARYDPDRIVEAIEAKKYKARIELERVILSHPRSIPIVVPLRFPLLEEQASAYLNIAGYSEQEISNLLCEWWLMDDPASFV